MDEIGDDEEIPGKAHLLDDAELELQPLAVGLGRLHAAGFIHLRRPDLERQTMLEAIGGAAAQFFCFRAAVLHRKGRQDRLAGARHVGAAPGDDQRIVDRLRQIGEQRPHFLRRLEVVLRRNPAALGLADIAAAGDAEQRVMSLEHAAVGEENLVRRHQRQIVGVGEVEQFLLDALLGFLAMAHQLDIEPAGKQRRKLAQRGLSRVVLPFCQQPPDAPRRSAGQRDEAVAMAVQQTHGHLRRIAGRGFQKGPADQYQQIAIAGLGLHQQHKLVGLRLRHRPVDDGAVPLLFPRNGELAANDRLHARILGRQGEFQCAEQVAGIGDRHRRHPLAAAEIDQLLDLDGAFGQRVGRMDAEMDEIGVGHGRMIPQVAGNVRGGNYDFAGLVSASSMSGSAAR